MHWAAGSNALNVVKYLIECRGLSPSMCEGKSNGRGMTGRSALHFAARNGHLDVVRYLCEACDGVDCDHRAKSNVSPFQLSVWQNHFEVARYLVEEKVIIMFSYGLFFASYAFCIKCYFLCQLYSEYTFLLLF